MDVGRVIDSFPAPSGAQRLSFSSGNWVQLFDFTPVSPQAQVLLTYGNASRPGSTHITDQLPLFEQKALRAALRGRSEVEKNAVRRESF